MMPQTGGRNKPPPGRTKCIVAIAPENASKTQRLDVRSLTVIELLAILLCKSEDDLEFARGPASELLRASGGIAHIADLLPDALSDGGLSTHLERLKFHAGIELGRRSARAGKGELASITRPEDVAELMSDLTDLRQEHFCAILLDTKKNVIRRQTVHVGTLSMSVVGVKEFFRLAVIESADTIIAVHNHPSGDPTPSSADIEVTRHLAEAGKLLEIPLEDHVIVAHSGFRSLRRLGLIG